MSRADRCQGCGRILYGLAVLLLAPIVVPYLLFLAGYGLADRRAQRRRRGQP